MGQLVASNRIDLDLSDEVINYSLFVFVCLFIQFDFQ